MKIFSYNVNGIRAAMSKGFVQWLSAASPDVICLQEIKALESQIDLLALEEAGYRYHYFHSAEKRVIVAWLSSLKKNLNMWK